MTERFISIQEPAVAVVAVTAGVFARTGTDATQNSREDVVREIDAVGLLVFALRYGAEIAWDVCACRTGDAAGDAALHPVKIFRRRATASVYGQHRVGGADFAGRFSHENSFVLAVDEPVVLPALTDT